MKTSHTLLLTVILGSAAFVSMPAIEAQAARECTDLTRAGCACQMALESGSQATMRRFLRDYPDGDTICNAKASTVGVSSVQRFVGGYDGSSDGPSPRGRIFDDDNKGPNRGLGEAH